MIMKMNQAVALHKQPRQRGRRLKQSTGREAILLAA